MNNSLPMRYYGRGAGKIIMPRAVLRENRTEWYVKPSLIILILAISCILILRFAIINNKKIFKDTKTVVILPEAPPVPEPTVKKKIPLIKVLKTAVKKTIEPKKNELKKIMLNKPKPKHIKPKRLIPKKIKPLDIKKNSVKPKKLELKKLSLNKIKLKKVQTQKLKTNTIKAKTLKPAKLKAKNLNLKKVAVKTPTNRKVINKATNPTNKLPKKFAPKTPVVSTQQPKLAANTPVAAPRRTFNAMPTTNRKSVTAPNAISQPRAITHSVSQPGPAPTIQQWAKATPQLETGSTSSVAPPTARVAAPAPLANQINIEPSGAAESYEEMVIIKSTALGSSRRVKNLKRAIMKKAGNMSHKNSPYQYKVKGYRCTVIIKSNNQVIIEFSPADASFDVVSALERMLPR